MKDFKFSGQKSILIFGFLSSLVEEARALEINEGQLIICLPHRLTKTTAGEYRSTTRGNHPGGLSYMPEAVKYFLRLYVTEPEIPEQIASL